jgi:hypothetical protein
VKDDFTNNSTMFNFPLMRAFLGAWGTLGMDRVIVLGDAHHIITKDKTSKRFMVCCNSQ